MTRSLDKFDPAAVLQTAAESIIVTTTELRSPGPVIIYANRAFEQMTGWTADEVIGRSPRILQGEKTDRAIFADMAPLILSGRCWQGQTVNYRKDGSEFVMEWSINPLLDEAGRTTHYVAVQRDVTARVAAEERIREVQRAQREADRKKSNLARYFSPRTVEILAERNQPLGKVRRQNVAVLMVDIVGFTALCEKLSPERVVALLRSFYRRMAKIIFDHEGSIEHFAGDSLLAVFGVPDAGARDAGNALACAVKMKGELARWNEKRLAANRDMIDVGISAHYGTVVLGDIGTKQSMSFTVIGDTVNTASRIQELCRSLRRDVLVSQELLDKAQSETQSDNQVLEIFTDAGTHSLRGRAIPIKVLAVDENLL